MNLLFYLLLFVGLSVKRPLSEHKTMDQLGSQSGATHPTAPAGRLWGPCARPSGMQTHPHSTVPATRPLPVLERRCSAHRDTSRPSPMQCLLFSPAAKQVKENEAKQKNKL